MFPEPVPEAAFPGTDEDGVGVVVRYGGTVTAPGFFNGGGVTGIAPAGDVDAGGAPEEVDGETVDVSDVAVEGVGTGEASSGELDHDEEGG